MSSAPCFAKVATGIENVRKALVFARYRPHFRSSILAMRNKSGETWRRPPLMSTPDFRIHGLDHVQLAMPAGQENLAREFYAGLLGLAEVPKPANLAKRGGVWFEGGALRLHLGVESDFRAAKKAHPAILV